MKRFPMSLCLLVVGWVAVLAWGREEGAKEGVAFRYSMKIEFFTDNGKVLRTLPLELVAWGDEGVILDAQDRPRVVFDFVKRSVRDDTGHSGTLEELTKAAEAERAKTLASLGDFRDPEDAKRVKLMCEPGFAVEEKEGGIKLANEISTYEIKLGTMSAERRERLYLMDRLQVLLNPKPLNPPFASLAVTAEMEKRESYAREVVLTMRSKKSVVHIRSTAEVKEVSAEEVERYRGMVRAIPQ